MSPATKEVEKAQAKELFLPFRCFCTKKLLKCNEVMIEDKNIAKALVNYVVNNSIDILVLGAPSRSGLLRFKTTDVPNTVSKEAPSFCTVYVVGKGKISYMRAATTSLSQEAYLPNQKQHQTNKASDTNDTQFSHNQQCRGRKFRLCSSICYFPPHVWFLVITQTSFFDQYSMGEDAVSTTKPAIRSMPPTTNLTAETNIPQMIIQASSVLSGFSSTIQKKLYFYKAYMQDELEAEMRRLRLELKQTMDMYSTACKEALTAKQKATELHRWKLEEEQRLEQVRLAQEAALALAENEKLKCMAAMEAAEAAQRIAVMEAQKRRNAEMKAFKEAEEKKKAIEAKTYDFMFRKYTIEEIEAATNNFSRERPTLRAKARFCEWD
ncbi:hypothetical protein DVH24_002035 [Malus domestica]|uniref:RING-type E3 ubiquitin transferase n=2 Tax=Malus domestica TaxID=3750 RepID=A0A498I955_MALDO|nr:hypothetical protein DVH24_002035 [Malus domestica]